MAETANVETSERSGGKRRAAKIKEMIEWKHGQRGSAFSAARLLPAAGFLVFFFATLSPTFAEDSGALGQASQTVASPQKASPATATETKPSANQTVKPSNAPVQSTDQAPQNSTITQQNGAYTITTVVNEVNLIFTVTDKHGHFIRDLKESDFSLLDDRMAPAEVYSFTQQTNLPLRVGLLIDTSSSIRSRFQFEQNAAVEFMLSVLRPKIDKAFVMGFDVTPDITQGYTNNGDLLSTGIRKLSPGGGTALYDAVYSACHDELLPLHGPPLIRKVIILLSDGDDNQSHATLDDAVKMCQRADTTIYSISTNDSPSRDRGDDILKAMSLVTGGRAFYPPRMEDVATAFQGIQEELRSQYSLVYKPADFKADGSFRPIFLTSYDRKYKVRVQKGYFAPNSPQ
jgi:Ca-activated chloride channel family protein